MNLLGGFEARRQRTARGTKVGRNETPNGGEPRRPNEGSVKGKMTGQDVKRPKEGGEKGR